MSRLRVAFRCGWRWVMVEVEEEDLQLPSDILAARYLCPAFDCAAAVNRYGRAGIASPVQAVIRTARSFL